jgi:Co/Zn/Cd efflux system component
MSDLSASSNAPAGPAPRPVSVITVIAIFITFAFFLLLVWYMYLPRQSGAFVGDGIHTAEQRTKNLVELRAKQNAAATTYGWVDQKAGVVRLPIERAIELTAQQYGAKK